MSVFTVRKPAICSDSAFMVNIGQSFVFRQFQSLSVLNISLRIGFPGDSQC